MGKKQVTDQRNSALTRFSLDERFICMKTSRICTFDQLIKFPLFSRLFHLLRGESSTRRKRQKEKEN